VGRLNLAVVAVVCVTAACTQRASEVRQDAALRDLVANRVPGVEKATGLRFKTPPVAVRRTRTQVCDYAVHRLDAEHSAAEFASIEAGYKLFGFFPDSTDLRSSYLNLLCEQIAGYYDPDSAQLFVVADVDSFLLRTTLSHELVHALQHQYIPLDSIMKQKRQTDRARAAHAVLEGQATLAQTLVMMPELNRGDLPSFWEQRSVLNQQQAQMKEFAGAPLWLRETLVFPYLAGADFVRWYETRHPGQHPFGRDMPTSTEQILHPERYAAGDSPIDVSFLGAPLDTVRYEDGLGEFETRLLFQKLLQDPTGLRATAYAQGWAGDRYQLLGADLKGLALLWYSVWDDQAAAGRFERALRQAWQARPRAGRVSRIEPVTIEGKPGVRLVDAPADWPGWPRLPAVKVGLGIPQSPK
jgi:hypothetical protein